MKKRVLKTDVLIVGSGGAAIRAAIEAGRSNANVILVTKRRITHSSTMVAGGGFRVASTGLTPCEHFCKTIMTGKFLNNQRLVRILAEEGPSKLKELGNFGVQISLDSPGHYSISGSFPGGPRLVQSLYKVALGTGVKIIEDMMVVDLVRDGGITGAYGLDLTGKRLVLIEAKAIIIATGGAGQLYRHTNNPPRITGDGYAMAYRIGAHLIDMEFIQFYPLGLAQKGVPRLYLPGSAIVAGVLRNVHGEDFLEKYGFELSEALSSDRDFLSVAIAREISQGRGANSAVTLDLIEVSRHFKKLKLGKYKVKPIQHFCMGGIKINECCETNVQGLYAVGEVTGGVHGANRLGGNALTELMVFGARAGKYAAAYALNSPKIHLDVMLTKKKHLELSNFISCRNCSKLFLDGTKEKIQMIMEKLVKVIRGKSSLDKALVELKKIRAEGSSEAPVSSAGLMEAFETTNMVDIAEIIVRSALYRTESRGAHYRSDYPRQNDDAWTKNIVTSMKDGAMQLSTQPVPTLDR